MLLGGLDLLRSEDDTAAMDTDADFGGGSQVRCCCETPGKLWVHAAPTAGLRFHAAAVVAPLQDPAAALQEQLEYAVNCLKGRLAQTRLHLGAGTACAPCAAGMHNNPVYSHLCNDVFMSKTSFCCHDESARAAKLTACLGTTCCSLHTGWGCPVDLGDRSPRAVSSADPRVLSLVVSGLVEALRRGVAEREQQQDATCRLQSDLRVLQSVRRRLEEEKEASGRELGSMKNKVRGLLVEKGGRC